MFEITSSPLAVLIDIVVFGVALSDGGETEKKGETNGKLQNRTSPLSVDSTGLWLVSCGWSYASPLFNVAL